MKPTFPRLLVATEFPPNSSGGGPAIVRQMLEQWPLDSLFWWSCSPDPHSRFGRVVGKHFVAHIPERLYPRLRLTRPKAQLLETAWAPWAAGRLRAAIKECRPDIIWAIPHQWSIRPLASALPTSGVPYHVSIHDYPDAHYSDERIGTGLTARLVHLTEELFRTAQTRDAISEEMADDLQSRTGRAAEQILHAGLEAEDFDYLQRKRSSEAPSIRIAYTGTIVAEDTFRFVVESLARVRSQLPKPLEMHFFGAHSYVTRPWFDGEWMIEHGDFDASKLREALRDFAWGFAPMELDDVNPRYNRFSLPTKVVSYLAAGLAMITAGHSLSPIARLGRNYALGISIDEDNAGGVDEMLRAGLSAKDIWAQRGAEILRCAQEGFDGTRMKQQLYNRLGVQLV